MSTVSSVEAAGADTVVYDALDRGVIGERDRRQLVVLGVGVGLWFIFWISGKGMAVGLVPLVIAGLLVAKPPFASDAAVYWIPVWCGRLVHGGRAQEWFRPLHLTTGDAAVDGGPVLPDWLGGIDIVEHPTAGWAAIRDDVAGTLTAHLQFAGSGFSTLSKDRMEFLVSGWGPVFGSVPPEEGLVRITWSAIARREPLEAHDEWAASQPGRPDRLTQYREYVAARRPMRHDLVLTVTIKPAGLRKVEDQKAAMEDLAATVDVVRDAVEEAGLGIGEILSGEEIGYLMRLGLDPTGVEPARDANPGSLVRRLGLVPKAAAGPMRTVKGRKHTLVDNVLHRVLWVEAWPRDAKNVEWFRDVVAADTVLVKSHKEGGRDLELAQRVFTLIVEPTVEDDALAEMRRASARHGGEQAGAAEGRTVWDAFKALKSTAVARRQSEVAAGHVPLKYAALIDVVVEDDDDVDLNRCAKAVARRCRRKGLQVRHLWGRNEQAVAAVLPLGLGLSREPF